jgi:hypothetical protein
MTTFSSNGLMRALKTACGAKRTLGKTWTSAKCPISDIASAHSITLLARASRGGGIARASALAALRLPAPRQVPMITPEFENVPACSLFRIPANGPKPLPMPNPYRRQMLLILCNRRAH